jgi:hypothetical protein
MFEPGQKVIVTKSNVTRKTGPRQGSVGFVSDFEVKPRGIRFHKIVWYKYGNQQKRRLESSSFAFIYGKGSRAQHADWRYRFHCRNYGTIEPLIDTRRIEDIDELEFKCWAYSIISTRARTPKFDAARINNDFWVTPTPFLIRHQDYPSGRRLKIAKRVRGIRDILVKSQVADIEKRVEIALKQVFKAMSKGRDEEYMLRNVALRPRSQWSQLYILLFAKMEFEGISGRRAAELMGGDDVISTCLRRMREEWRRMHGFSS